MRSAKMRSVLGVALFAALVFPCTAWAIPGARHKHGKAPVEGVLNVNRASEAELQLLPGIGKGRAETIVARRQVKPFASLEDVARIKGLRRLVQRLHAHLSVEGPTTLHPIVRPASAEPAMAEPKTGPPASPRSGA